MPLDDSVASSDVPRGGADRFEARAEAEVAAPIAVVWDMVADARRYRTWAAMPSTTLEREGAGHPDGVGAIRNFGVGRVGSREEVVAFEPPHHLGYVLLKGLPISDYRADVRLTEVSPDLTRIEWVGTFRAPGVRGRVMQRFLSVVLGDFVRRISKVAPTRS